MSTTVTTPRTTRTKRVPEHRGDVHFRGEPAWEEARTPWNLAVDQRPAAVFLPEDAADIAAAVRYARDAGLRVAVQGTGHMASPLGDLEQTALIKTNRMRGVHVDAAARRATVEAGAIWDEVVAPATASGLTALHGSSPDVGVVGYSLGGGIGWLARLHGLATNSITAIELVTADGEVVRTDATHDPELFWGLRGGVANFGIVTRLELELFPLETAYAGWLIWDWERTREVLDRWVEWTETTADTVTTAGRILRLPPIDEIPELLRGRDLVVVEAAYAGDEASGRKLLSPLRELQPELDTVEIVPAAALARLHQDPEGASPGVGNGGLVDGLPPDAVGAVGAVAGPGSDSPLVSLEFRQLGGALGRPAPGGGALSHLEGAFAWFGVGVPMGEGSGEAISEHVGAVQDALAPWSSGRAYTNFSEKRVDTRSIFGPEAFTRLQALRQRMDPDGVFHPSQEIPMDG